MKDIAQTVLAQNNQQKKYIRTFARDVQTLQEGGTPDFALFHAPEVDTPAENVEIQITPARLLPLENELSPEERDAISSIESAPVIINEEPIVVPALMVPPLAPTEPASPLPAPFLPPKPEIKQYPDSALSPLETYGGDFRDRMNDLSASPIAVLAAEQDARPAPGAAPDEGTLPREKVSVWPVVAGVAFLVAGVGGLFFAYAQYQKTTAPVIVAPSMSAPIFFDTNEQVAGSGAKLAQAIAASAAEPLSQGTVRLLSLGQNATTSIFSALALRAPGLLTRNIENAGSMAGIVSVGTGQSPFFILTANSYSTTFSGMLSWEVRMPGDLALLYPAYGETLNATTTINTTTGAVPAPKPGFHDEVVANHDVRVYRDAALRSVLLYGYWNETTLIIARNPIAFAELLDRLATSHTR